MFWSQATDRPCSSLNPPKPFILDTSKTLQRITFPPPSLHAGPYQRPCLSTTSQNIPGNGLINWCNMFKGQGKVSRRLSGGVATNTPEPHFSLYSSPACDFFGGDLASKLTWRPVVPGPGQSSRCSPTAWWCEASARGFSGTMKKARAAITAWVKILPALFAINMNLLHFSPFLCH